MVLTEEFKRELIAEIKHDAAFGFDLYYALLGSVNGDALTKTYLDEALAKQSRNFDAKLERQAQALTLNSKNWHGILTPNSNNWHGILTPNSTGKRRLLTPNSKNWHEILTPNSWPKVSI